MRIQEPEEEKCQAYRAMLLVLILGLTWASLYLLADSKGQSVLTQVREAFTIPIASTD